MCWCTMLLCMRLYHIHQNVYPPKYWASLRFCDFRQLWAGSLHKAITTTDLTTSTSIAIVLNVVLMNTMNTTNTTITTITTMITMQRCQRWRNGGKRLQCLANWTNTELGMYNLCSSQELTMKNWDDWFVGNILGQILSSFRGQLRQVLLCLRGTPVSVWPSPKCLTGTWFHTINLIFKHQ